MRGRSGIRARRARTFTNLANNVGTRLAGKKRNHNNTASRSFYFPSPHDLVGGPIPPFDKNIRQKSGNQFVGSEIVENDDGIHTFKGGQNFSALVLGDCGAAFPLELVHCSVAVDANNKDIAERPTFLQALQVPEVKNVKAAICEDDAAAIAFLAAKPQNRFLKCQGFRMQRISKQAQKRNRDSA
jgi:hypothetical protein